MIVKTFGTADPRALEQLERCTSVEDGALGVLCADNHVGYSQPIGGVVAYESHVSPSGVGYDIACGNAAARTPLRADDVDVGGVLDEVERTISFGMGRANREPADSPVLDAIREAPFAPQRQLYDLAAKQLGTVGAGNHYVDLFADEEGFLWVGVHFGSRGFGHKTASGFLSLAQGGRFDERGHDGEMDSPPVVLPIDSELGQAYIDAMTLAGEYAYAGRDWVVDRVLQILGTAHTERVHNHHNFAWLEEHDGRELWVIRKGATPAQPGQRGFVGGSMGDVSVILEGVESEESRLGLRSTIHGAGRVMSRTKAAGKVRRRKRWACSDRDCSFATPTHGEACPDHPDARMRKVWVTEQKSQGLIDWPAVQVELRGRGIDVRGGAADEAPGVYKRLPDVLEAHAGSVRVVHRLQPLGVVMAGADVFDPFKD